jgi:hypothetical protein
MGTLDSELGPYLEQPGGVPRFYADANVPAPLVAFMRQRLRWDVLFVLEHDELRRASDVAHFQMAGRLRRTLLTLDRDYFDDRRFPPAETAGVIVVSAPSERGFTRLLRRVDRALFSKAARARGGSDGTLPLRGRKLDAHVDWRPEPEP